MYKEFSNVALNSVGWTALIALGVAIAFIVLLAFYIYKSVALMKIAKRLRHKHAWLAWIPIADVAMVLQLGDFHWAWIFLILIPIFGWVALYVLFIIANWRIFEECDYPGWFSLSLLIPKIGIILYLIVIGLIVWSNPITKTKVNKKSQKFVDWVKKDTKRKARNKKR